MPVCVINQNLSSLEFFIILWNVLGRTCSFTLVKNKHGKIVIRLSSESWDTILNVYAKYFSLIYGEKFIAFQKLSMIKNLTSNPVNEGMPNILAVGDDDQAIFKFQGAELDNISKFSKTYRNVKYITLDKNYRSSQEILDEAKEMREQINDRLDVRMPDKINKNILAQNEKVKDVKGNIQEKQFENFELESQFIASKIEELLYRK